MTGYETFLQNWRAIFGADAPISEERYTTLKTVVIDTVQARAAEFDATRGDCVFADLGALCFLAGAYSFMAATGEPYYKDRHPDQRGRVQQLMHEAAARGALFVQENPPPGLVRDDG